MSGKDGTGGGGWVHPNSENGIGVSGLCCEKILVIARCAISHFKHKLT